MSIQSVVKAAHDRQQNSGKVKRMSVECSADNKHYIVEHHTEGYDHPHNSTKHVVKKSQLNTHIAEHMPLGGAEDE